MLVYIYDIPGPPGGGTDITDRCRLGVLSVKDNAEEGSVAISSLVVDDPDGDIDLTGHRRLYIYETSSPAFDQMVFDGYIANERVSRGPFRTELGRIWTLDVADTNVHLRRRIMNGTDANRPAETDIQRISALLTMAELSTVTDSIYFNLSAATTAMDAVDYRGQNVGDYIDDCRQASGKNAYIFYREAVGKHSLWYDFASSTAYDSGLFLSNVLADINQTTVFEYSQERTYLNRDPSRVASGIYLAYDGGTVYVQDTAVYATFASIDWAAPSVNVKSSAKATARANRYLADSNSEDDIIHTVMLVPRAKVNALKKGQLVMFKGVHLPGYESYVRMRVLYRTVSEISEDPEASFEIEMDLTPVPITPAVSSFVCLAWDDLHFTSNGGRVYWTHSGDRGVPAGYKAGDPPYPNGTATTGLLSKIATVSPPYSAVDPSWTGVLVSGTGNVDVYATMSLVTVIGGGTTTATYSLYLNGVSIASTTTSKTCGGFLCGWSSKATVTKTALAVVPGDVLEAYLTITALPGGFTIPAGTGTSDQRMVVTGTLV
jgi:hypothetical protein